MAQVPRMESEIWYATNLRKFAVNIEHVYQGDVAQIKAMGQNVIILSSAQAALDLLEAKGSRL